MGETPFMKQILLSVVVVMVGVFSGFESAAQEKTVTVIDPKTNPKFQKYLDEALLEIMSTEVGKAICVHILGGQLDMIEKHIGVSKKTAALIKNRCATRPAKQIPYIFASNEEELVKISDSISTEKREYFFIFNLNKPWPMDSWTDPIGNRTYLILQKDWLEELKKSKEHEVNKALNILLYQMLAHELAIYFDPKHFPGGDNWDRLGLNQSIQWPQAGEDLEKVYSALMNPMIASALSFIRAFQIERMIMIELAAKKGFSLPAEYANSKLINCKDNCNEEMVRKISMYFSDHSATLLALSPQYRNRLMVSFPDFAAMGVEEELNMAVHVWPTLFYEQFVDLKDVTSPWVLLLPTATVKQAALQTRVSQFITQFLFTRDFTYLMNQKVYDNSKSVSVLEFMSRPLLSGYNIRLSTGPRARIRGGDIR